jgi:hypothetical protein
MYVLDRSSNKRVEGFKDTETEEEEDDVEDNDEEEKEEADVPKSKLSKKTYEKLPIANKKTMKETSVPSGKDEQLILEEPISSNNNNDDVVSYVSKWVSGLNIPSSLKTETFKELFSEENIEKMKSMVSFQQAKDWVNSIISSLNKKEAFIGTASQRRTITQLKDKLKQMENDLDNLMVDIDEISNNETTVKPESSNNNMMSSFGPPPASSTIPIFDSTSTRRTVNNTEISLDSLPSVNTTNQETKSTTIASSLNDKESLFAKKIDTVSPKIIPVMGNNVIEGFENVRHKFAAY